MANKEIRREIVRSGLKHWEVAAKYGCTDSTFSRKLRQELAPEEKTKIRDIIAQLAKERDESA